MALKLTGVGLSPFVRKARIALAYKGLEFEHDPMVPMGVPEEYKQKHPLGKIPLLEDGDKLIPDSSAISVYLEAIRPDPALYPQEAYDRARAVWLEEYADTALASGATTIFAERILAKMFFQREPDEAAIAASLNEALPPVFDYLQRTLGDAEFMVGGSFSIADIAVASPLGNFALAGGEIDASRWPELAAYLARIHSWGPVGKVMEEDRAGLKAMAASA